MSEYERHAYDVVVVGAGGAGLRAAIAAHDAGAHVAVVCKSLLGKAHTVMAEGGFGMGLGTLVLLVNAVLLWLYSLSCHSCRHVVGGRLRSFSKHPVRYKMWTQVSRLNTRHPVYAWASLVWVALTDFYVRLLASGAITDLRFF